MTRSGLLPALWIGLVAGVLEIAIRATQHFLFGKLVFVGVDFWWAAPLLTAILIAIPAVLVAGAFSFSNSQLALAVRFGVPVGLACMGLLLLVPGLSRIAAALLALGLGVRTGSWLALRADRFERLVRRTIPVLLIVPVLGGAGLHLSRVGREALLRARKGGAAGPNVLLIVLDTVRAMELGLYGQKPTPSPYLDGFGAQGVVFDQAFATAPWTAPSHGSLFTGRRVHELSIDWTTRLDGTYSTLAEVLGSAGYSTAGFVANTEYASAETGLGRGFDHYEDYGLSVGEILQWTGLSRGTVNLWQSLSHAPPRDLAGRIGAEQIDRRFLHWLDHRPPRPFFAFLNFFDAHAPYFPPEPFWSRFLPGEPRRPRTILPGGTWSMPAVASGRRAYQGAIAYLDGQLAALFDSLRVRALLRETVVIVVGDHGEEFLEHGLMGHGNSLYAPSLRVPLLLVWPGHLPAGYRVREPISLASVSTTVMELLGRPGPFPAPGLAGYWSGRPPPAVAVTSAVTLARNLPAWYPVSHGALASARLGRYRYIWSPLDSTGQLYDHDTDPLESRNLVAEPSMALVLRALRDTVAAVTPGKPPPRP